MAGMGEIATLVPLVVFIVWIGVYPGTFLKTSAGMAKQVVQTMESARQGGQARFVELKNR